MARARFRPRLRKAGTPSGMTLQVARQTAIGGGHKGSRSLRTRRTGLWQQAVDFGGVGGRGVSQIVAQLARGLHRGT
jgi:hypothetical protein